MTSQRAGASYSIPSEGCSHGNANPEMLNFSREMEVLSSCKNHWQIYIYLGHGERPNKTHLWASCSTGYQLTSSDLNAKNETFKCQPRTHEIIVSTVE